MNLRYTLSFLRILKIPGLYPHMKDWQASIRINFSGYKESPSELIL